MLRELLNENCKLTDTPAEEFIKMVDEIGLDYENWYVINTPSEYNTIIYQDEGVGSVVLLDLDGGCFIHDLNECDDYLTSVIQSEIGSERQIYCWK